MSAMISTATAALVLTLAAAAPQRASAQAMFPNYPGAQWNTGALQTRVPADARNSVSKATHHRVRLPSDARASAVIFGALEGGPYTPSMPAPRGQNPDFQDGPR